MQVLFFDQKKNASFIRVNFKLRYNIYIYIASAIKLADVLPTTN